MGFHWPKKGFHWPTNIFSSFSWSWFPPPWWRQRWLRSQVIIFPFSNLSKVRCLLIHDHLYHQVLATCKSQNHSNHQPTRSKIHFESPTPQNTPCTPHSLRLRTSSLCRPCGARWSVKMMMMTLFMMMLSVMTVTPHPSNPSLHQMSTQTGRPLNT